MNTKRGRPAKFGERKQIISITVTPTLVEFLKSNELSASEQIESTIRNTLAFMHWSRNRDATNDTKPAV